MDAITTHQLCKQYNNRLAVNRLQFHVKVGELVALVGTNGAGKTTTVKMLSTLVPPTSGSAIVCGFDLIKDASKIREMLNISPQETAIAPNLTVKENLDFFAGVYQIKDANSKIQELICQFHLEAVIKQKAKTLSGGWKRKLSIALSLINSPKVLFLDEPTLGLDVISRKELWDIIQGLKGESTILLTTHYMEEAEHLADRIAIMHEGSLLYFDTPQHLMKTTGTAKIEDAFTSIIAKEGML